MQDIIKKDDQNYKSKRGKTDKKNLFLLKKNTRSTFIDRRGWLISQINKQINFDNELKHFNKDTKTLDKRYVLINLRKLFGAREKVLQNFKTDYFW